MLKLLGADVRELYGLDSTSALCSLALQPLSYRKVDATSVSALANWLLRRRGVLTSCLLEATLFTRTRPGLVIPDLQIHVVSSPGSRDDLKYAAISFTDLFARADWGRVS